MGKQQRVLSNMIYLQNDLMIKEKQTWFDHSFQYKPTILTTLTH